jgi:DNA-binding response OmpR family regulator
MQRIGAQQSHPAEDSNAAATGRAVLVGFPQALETALSALLASRQFVVHALPEPSAAIELVRTTRIDLVLASSRCSTASVVMLTEALGKPRSTRVIVLLAGRDRAVERRYREAGLAYVMTMPVDIDDLLRVAFPRAPQ